MNGYASEFEQSCDDELLQLWTERAGLVPEAAASLRDELRRRGLGATVDVEVSRGADSQESETSEAALLDVGEVPWTKIVKRVGAVVIALVPALLTAILVRDALRDRSILFLVAPSLVLTWKVFTYALPLETREILFRPIAVVLIATCVFLYLSLPLFHR